MVDNIEWDKGELERRFGVEGGDADPMWAFWDQFRAANPDARWSLGQWPRTKYEWIEEEPVDSIKMLMEGFGLKEVGPEGVKEGDAFFRYQDRLWVDGTAPKGTAKTLAVNFAMALLDANLVSRAQVRAMFDVPVDHPEVLTDGLVTIPPQVRLSNSEDGGLDDEGGDGADDDDQE